MSASLVGSEMCIRDRAWVAGWHQPTIRTTPLSDHPCLLLEDGAEEVKTCLLYTSDAADDM
eukprot:9715149-Alexandrium_andersonii.AAC.1